MKVDADKNINLENAAEMISLAKERGAEFICLPEVFNSVYDTAHFRDNAEEDGGKTYSFLKETARKHHIYLIGGSIPELDIDKVYNTSYVFNPSGELIAKHRKVHLFDINFPGEIEFMESEELSSGSEITTFDTPYGKMAVAICFDIRFSEYFKLIQKQDVKLIFVPAAFNMKTGPAHWELAFRSRAVDNQLFIAGCSPARNITASYIAYGNSLVVDPLGNVLRVLDEKEGILVEKLDLNVVEETRKRLPLIKNRRADLYDTIKLK